MTPNQNDTDDALTDNESAHDRHAHSVPVSDVTASSRTDGADRESTKRTGNAAPAPHRQTVIDLQTETNLLTESEPGSGSGSGSGSECQFLRHVDTPLLERPRSPRPGNSPRRLLSPSLPSTPMSDAEPVAMYYDPSDTYAPLLHCPACTPPVLLVAPTTLHCGHTVCSKHVRKPPTDPSSSASASLSQKEVKPSRISLTRGRSTGPPPPTGPIIPSCPLPTCHPGTTQQPLAVNIPPESSVAYYPPLVQPAVSGLPDPMRVTVADPRIDVSVGRVLGLLEKARKQVDDRKRAERNEEHSDDETDEDVEGVDEEESIKSASTSSLERRRRTGVRPRSYKRPRTGELSEGIHHQRHRAAPATREELEERFHKELQESFACEICFMLLYQPVTTPCQHTFCAKCLQRSLDHGSKCPLCRQNMPPFSYFQDHPYNKVILAILLKAFPEIYEERGRSIEDEERNTRLDTPIFVYQLSFPGMPTLLHFFEPRYRLMLRRCLESRTPCFGMITPPRTVGSSGGDYGTMLEIRSVQMLPDGRSMVETWGIYRFRILETGTLDGYMVGRIERVDDIPEELEDEAERSIASMLSAQFNSSGESSSSSPSPSPASPRTLQPTTDELLAVCHAFVGQLRNGTAPWVVQRLNNTYGPMPADTSSFTFWMAQVLPIDEHEKAKLLVIRSSRGRLRLVVHWIEQLNSNWWFSSGCIIS